MYAISDKMTQYLIYNVFSKRPGKIVKFGIEYLYPDPEYSKEYRLSRPWVERARPDILQNRKYYEIKTSGYDRNNPKHKGPLMQALEFAYQVNYWKPITHFLYVEKEKKWYVFSMEEALKNVLFIRHIPECNPYENVKILRQLLPDLKDKIKTYPKSYNDNASNSDSVVLDLNNIKFRS